MGCGLSKGDGSKLDAAVSPAGGEKGKQSKKKRGTSTQWRQGVSKDKARKTYEADGTLPKQASMDLLELRCFMAEPVLLNRLGEFAKEIRNLDTIMCWADILEFKSIDEKAWDLQVSKALHIYHKYMKADAIVPISGVSLSKEWVQRINVALVEAQANNTPLSKNMFDEYQQQCLIQICNKIFNRFKSTVMYHRSMSDLKSSYNQVTLEDFEYFESLGHGSYGFVVHCVKKSTRKHYAMKIQTKVGLIDCFSDCPERVVFEKEAVASCHHPFIISMDYAFQTQTLALMVMDLGTAGSLMDALAQCENSQMSEERVRFYSAEIVLALAHIHRMGLIYRDLKPANVLLNDDGHIQLVDLGGIIDVGGKVLGYHNDGNESALFEPADAGGKHMTSPGGFDDASTMRVGARKKVSSQDENDRNGNESPNEERTSRNQTYRIAERPHNLQRAKSIMGTGGYMAPEMLVMMQQHWQEKIGYTAAVDYWSLGVMMFKLLTGSLPFHNSHVAHFIDYVNSHPSHDELNNKNYPPAYATFFRKLNECPELSIPCMEIMVGFLEVKEQNRLGSGALGVKQIQKHPFFENIQWRLLAQKHVEPPFIPINVPRDDDNAQSYPSFESMIAEFGKEKWLHQSITTKEQSFFSTWDFISANILKVEMGIAEEMEESNTTFRVKIRQGPRRASAAGVPHSAGLATISEASVKTPQQRQSNASAGKLQSPLQIITQIADK